MSHIFLIAEYLYTNFSEPPGRYADGRMNAHVDLEKVSILRQERCLRKSDLLLHLQDYVKINFHSLSHAVLITTSHFMMATLTNYNKVKSFTLVKTVILECMAA